MYSKALNKSIQVKPNPTYYKQTNADNAKCLLRIVNKELMTNYDYHKTLINDALRVQSPKSHKIACFFSSVVCINRDDDRTNKICNQVKDFAKSTINALIDESETIGDETNASSVIKGEYTLPSAKYIKNLLSKHADIVLHTYIHDQVQELILVLEHSPKGGYQIVYYNLRPDLTIRSWIVTPEDKITLCDNLNDDNIVTMLSNLAMMAKKL